MNWNNILLILIALEGSARRDGEGWYVGICCIGYASGAARTACGAFALIEQREWDILFTDFMFRFPYHFQVCRSVRIAGQMYESTQHKKCSQCMALGMLSLLHVQIQMHAYIWYLFWWSVGRVLILFLYICIIWMTKSKNVYTKRNNYFASGWSKQPELKWIAVDSKRRGEKEPADCKNCESLNSENKSR